MVVSCFLGVFQRAGKHWAGAPPGLRSRSAPKTGLWESLKKAVALYPNLSDDETVGKDGTRHLNKKCVGAGTHCGAGECRQAMVCLLLEPPASPVHGVVILLTVGVWNLARLGAVRACKGVNSTWANSKHRFKI